MGGFFSSRRPSMGGRSQGEKESLPDILNAGEAPEEERCQGIRQSLFAGAILTADRRSDMNRMARRNPIVLIEKDGLVRNLFPMDGTLQKALGKGSGVRKTPTLSGRFLAALRRSLMFWN